MAPHWAQWWNENQNHKKKIIDDRRLCCVDLHLAYALIDISSLVAALGFVSGGIKILKLNSKFYQKRTWIYQVIDIPKKKKKKTQIHEILQFPFMGFHILKSLHDS